MMKLKVMSFNLRIESRQDGINHFDNRKENILRVIQTEQPDLIGFQEATDNMREWLRDSIGDEYMVLGCGRNREYLGESIPLAYRKRDFELISFETRFYSLTPTVPESRHDWSDQSNCPRMFVHAELKRRGIANPIHFYNTHFDHRGEQAQIAEMIQLLQSVSACKGQTVLTGDFNAKPDSPAIAMVSATGNKKLHDATDGIALTFHSYGKIKGDYKIDYIFTDAAAGDAYAVDDPHENGIYISDHYPLCAWVDFSEE